MITLYGAMLTNSTLQEDGRVIYTGGHIRVVTGRARRSFLTNGKFSANLVRAAYRHLIAAGCVRVFNGPGSFEKELVKSPVEVFGEPPRRSERKRENVTPDTEVEAVSRDAVVETEPSFEVERILMGHGATKSENDVTTQTTQVTDERVVTGTLVGVTVEGEMIIRADGQLYTLHRL